METTFFTIIHKDNGKLLVAHNMGVAWRYFPSHSIDQIQHLNHLLSFRSEEEANHWIEDCLRSALNPDWTDATEDKLLVIPLVLKVCTPVSFSDQIALEGRRSECGTD